MIGVLSDVHGNYPALIAVLDEMDRAGCDRILSLGDVAGYYCMVNECIEELRKRSVLNVLGNHDSYIVNHGRCPRSGTVNYCLDYQRRILKPENLQWLCQSVPFIKENGMWLVHGGWNDFVDEYVSDFSFVDDASDSKLFISGHTHIQKEVTGRYAKYYNPGSVGQPRDHLPTAGYLLIDDSGKVTLKRTEYDIDWIAAEMDRAGFQKRVTSCLYRGTRIGEDVGCAI